MIIAGSFLKIQDDKEKIEKLNEVVDQIHFDIMDGTFTENKTKIKEENIKNIDKPIDIHLMVYNVKKYVDKVMKYTPHNITFHIEVGNTLDNIKYIKEKTKVGLAINPDTDLNKLIPYLDKIDIVLVMSVPPGKGGQKFIDVEEKIKKLINIREKKSFKYKIEVDGGINIKTIKKVKTADIVVCGSYITDSDDYKNSCEKLRGEIDG